MCLILQIQVPAVSAEVYYYNNIATPIKNNQIPPPPPPPPLLEESRQHSMVSQMSHNLHKISISITVSAWVAACLPAPQLLAVILVILTNNLGKPFLVMSSKKIFSVMTFV